MKIIKYKPLYIATTFLSLLTACTDPLDLQETAKPDEVSPDEIRLQANKAHVLTRSGNEQKSYFDANTLFRIYAVQSGKADAWSNPANHIEDVHDVIASAASQNNGVIDFRSINGKVGKYKGRTLDIYAITWDKVADPAPDPVTNDFLPEALEAAPKASGYDPETGAPLINVDISDGQLPDLMRAIKRNNSGGQSQYIDLPFEHTVSKITFKTVVSDLTMDDGQYVVLNKVSLLGNQLYGSAQLNVADGKYYNYSNPVTAGLLFFNGADHADELRVGKDAPVQKVPGQQLIFPIKTTTTNPLNVKVEFTMPGESDPVSVTYPIDNIDFQPNYEYSFTLTFMDDNMHLVIFAPEVYDWIDIPLNTNDGNGDDDDALGKVVTFGGTTWMDRNLGAKSADPRTNWDQARGAYYQFARNIPYYFDQEAWNDRVKAVGIANADVNGRPQLSFNSHRTGKGYFYTFDQNGNKIYESINKDFGTNWQNCTATKLAINPGENKSYAFVAATSDGTTAWLLNGGKNTEDAAYNLYWQNINTQPCPKGWKMPTADDFRTFLPNPSDNNGTINATQKTGVSWVKEQFNCVINDGGEDRIFGKMKIWEDDELVPTVYLMKTPGTDDSYIIRIRLLAVKDASGNPVPTQTSVDGVKQYFEIYRYAVTDVTGNTFRKAGGQKMDQTEFRNRYTNDFWKNPVEKMYFGTYGHIGAATSGAETGLFLDGDGSFLKTSDHVGNGISRVAYMRPTHDGIGVKVKTSKAPGQQIRCVKDMDNW